MFQHVQPRDWGLTLFSILSSRSAMAAVLALAVTIIVMMPPGNQAFAQSTGALGPHKNSSSANSGNVVSNESSTKGSPSTRSKRTPGKQGKSALANAGGDSASGNRRRPGSGAPPANERRYVADEVVIELAADTTVEAAEALARRYGLARLESFGLQLAGTKLYRWRISDRRSVTAVVRLLEADRSVISVSPNYIMRLQGEGATAALPLEQYALAKLHVPQAHALSRGDKVFIAIIDGGVDTSHPELAGAIADTFDSIGSGDKVHPHGTAIAGAIAAQARLRGTAPAAQILAARAFGARSDKSESTTFFVVKSIDWAISRGARIINMSFAGPRDPKIELAIKAARANGIILVAAAGNAGPRSQPLYPAADPNVIAVTATDQADRLFPAANRGKHVAVAAPGVELLLPGAGGTYQETSGTSFAAAEVSGTIALMIERKRDLGHDEIRHALMSTARDLGPPGPDPEFGAGLVDAYQALLSIRPATVGAADTPSGD